MVKLVLISFVIGFIIYNLENKAKDHIYFKEVIQDIKNIDTITGKCLIIAVYIIMILTYPLIKSVMLAQNLKEMIFGK